MNVEDPNQMIRLALAGLFTAVMVGRGSDAPVAVVAKVAVELADALIAQLDKPASS